MESKKPPDKLNIVKTNIQNTNAGIAHQGQVMTDDQFNQWAGVKSSSQSGGNIFSNTLGGIKTVANNVIQSTKEQQNAGLSGLQNGLKIDCVN